MKKYDAIIIGSGQAGTPLSKKLANDGWKTALVEKEFVGGTCINVGCTPTKTMVASAKRMYDCQQAKKMGVNIGDITMDIKKVLARKDKVVEDFREASEKGLQSTVNLDLIYGTAAFIGNKELRVTDKQGKEESYTSNKIFIDVGARPFIPKIEGLDKVDYLTSTTIMELSEIPDHLLIIGGGYIGLEFGQMYRRFGSKVTILEEGKRFLSKEDEDVANCILEFLKQEDIEVLMDSNAIRIEKDAAGIKVVIKSSQNEKSILCSHILLATGRKSNTDLLQLDKTDIKTDKKGNLEVNNQLETSVKGVYGLGDVKGGPAFTHIAYNDFLVVYDHVVNGNNESYKDRLVPYTMFTDPQLGRVGITEQEAKEKNLNVKVASLSMKNVARAIETGDTRGIMKAVVDAESGHVLGAAIIGEQGGEVMTVLQMAMVGGVKWQQIKTLPMAHPLYAEALNNLFMQLK